MASERDLELLDDYLGNKLSADDKVAFEKSISTDSELRKEYQLQKQLVEGIKKARVAELKKMLGNVPVSSIPQEGGSSLIQIGAWIVAASVVGTGLFYILKDDKRSVTPVVQQETTIAEPEELQPQDATQEQQAAADEDAPVQAEDEIKPQAVTPNQNNQPAVEPKTDQSVVPATRDVFDPSDDNKSTDPPAGDGIKSSTAVTPSIAMETVTNGRYHFHYQFKENKLFLYGVFEKNLYEIMEFFSNNKRTMFLYYKDQYYLLNEGDDKVKPLSPINDDELLRKLKDYRGDK